MKPRVTTTVVPGGNTAQTEQKRQGTANLDAVTTLPIVDPVIAAKLESLAAGRHDEGHNLVGDLVETYLDMVPPLIGEIASAARQGELKTMTTLVHKLKDRSSNLGLRRISGICEIIEGEGATGRTDLYDDAIQALSLEYAFARLELKVRWGRED